jgi:tellurite resistance protein TerC
MVSGGDQPHPALVVLETVGTPLLWIGFTLVILTLLALDLGIFHRRDHTVSFREAAGWTVTYVILALIFGAGVTAKFGSDSGLEFYTGYLIELALSVDNLFVFLVLFGMFRVPAVLQHRVLFWGVLGALVMRALFILLGAALLQRFHFMIYVFGALLLVVGGRLLFKGNAEVHPETNPLVRLLRRFFPVTADFQGRHFLVKRDGRLWATPLLVVLVAIEATDVVFAVDSIPAIFGVTTDPFIVYTSNVFAILGLRSMFFVLSGLMDKFRFLPIGLAAVLIFIGLKMLGSHWVKVPTAISLGVVGAILGISVVVSLIFPGPPAPPRPPEPPADAPPATPPPGGSDGDDTRRGAAAPSGPHEPRPHP